jgi:hypothetical protein
MKARWEPMESDDIGDDAVEAGDMILAGIVFLLKHLVAAFLTASIH